MQSGWRAQIVLSYKIHYLLGILPLVISHLISADMDNLGREQVHHLIQHVLEKTQNTLVSRIEDIVLHTELAWDTNLLACRTQPRIGSYGRCTMSGHFYLRHDRDMTRRSIFDDFLYLSLSVEPLMRLAVIRIVFIPAHLSRISPRPHFCKQRVFSDFDSPALVIGQMPVEHIHFQASHIIQKLLYNCHSLERTPLIKHKRPPAELRGILYVTFRYADTVPVCSHNLRKRLQSIKCSGCPVGSDHHAVLRNRESIRLFILQTVIF